MNKLFFMCNNSVCTLCRKPYACSCVLSGSYRLHIATVPIISLIISLGNIFRVGQGNTSKGRLYTLSKMLKYIYAF